MEDEGVGVALVSEGDVGGEIGGGVVDAAVGEAACAEFAGGGELRDVTFPAAWDAGARPEISPGETVRGIFEEGAPDFRAGAAAKPGGGGAVVDEGLRGGFGVQEAQHIGDGNAGNLCEGAGEEEAAVGARCFNECVVVEPWVKSGIFDTCEVEAMECIRAREDRGGVAGDVGDEWVELESDELAVGLKRLEAPACGRAGEVCINCSVAIEEGGN